MHLTTDNKTYTDVEEIVLYGHGFVQELLLYIGFENVSAKPFMLDYDTIQRNYAVGEQCCAIGDYLRRNIGANYPPDMTVYYLQYPCPPDEAQVKLYFCVHLIDGTDRLRVWFTKEVIEGS